MKAGDRVRYRQHKSYTGTIEGPGEFDPGVVTVRWDDLERTEEFPEDLEVLVDLDRLRSIQVGLAAQPTRRTTISERMAARRRDKEAKGFQGGRS
jgi:hypothetical protein